MYFYILKEKQPSICRVFKKEQVKVKELRSSSRCYNKNLKNSKSIKINIRQEINKIENKHTIEKINREKI